MTPRRNLSANASTDVRGNVDCIIGYMRNTDGFGLTQAFTVSCCLVEFTVAALARVAMKHQHSEEMPQSCYQCASDDDVLTSMSTPVLSLRPRLECHRSPATSFHARVSLIVHHARHRVMYGCTVSQRVSGSLRWWIIMRKVQCLPPLLLGRSVGRRSGRSAAREVLRSTHDFPLNRLGHSR